MTDIREIPKYYELMNPLLQALRYLGGSGTIQEISTQVAEILNLPDDLLSILHNPEKSSQSELDYRLAWARSYLKRYGLIDNSQRGVWVIVSEKHNVTSVNPQQVVTKVRELYWQERKAKDNRQPLSPETEEISQEADGWREELHLLLTRDMQPDAFERLIKRVLRESGFVQLEVLGRSGDGGLDGKGVMRIGGFVSFHVFFQCKKYQGSVPSSAIRDFRGALMGRADKGLFVTTGTFTRDAVKEATRDGAPPIDLIDGDQLAEILKSLGLGVKTEMIESITIDPDFFSQI